jgi:hypothetical protein
MNLHLAWKYQSDGGERSPTYESLVSAVNHIIQENGNVLIRGGARIVASRIIYELVDVLEMLPKSVADDYIAEHTRDDEARRIREASVDDLGPAASAG